MLHFGINLTYNDTLLTNLNKFYNFSSGSIIIKCGDTVFTTPLANLNKINLRLLREQRFISNVLEKVRNLDNSSTLDFEISLRNSSLIFRNGVPIDLVQSEKIFQVEVSKIKNIKQSFYAYYKNKYFDQQQFFTISQDSSQYVKITIKKKKL